MHLALSSPRDMLLLVVAVKSRDFLARSLGQSCLLVGAILRTDADYVNCSLFLRVVLRRVDVHSLELAHPFEVAPNLFQHGRQGRRALFLVSFLVRVPGESGSPRGEASLRSWSPGKTSLRRISPVHPPHFAVNPSRHADVLNADRALFSMVGLIPALHASYGLGPSFVKRPGASTARTSLWNENEPAYP